MYSLKYHGWFIPMKKLQQQRLIYRSVSCFHFLRLLHGSWIDVLLVSCLESCYSFPLSRVFLPCTCLALILRRTDRWKDSRQITTRRGTVMQSIKEEHESEGREEGQRRGTEKSREDGARIITSCESSVLFSLFTSLAFQHLFSERDTDGYRHQLLVNVKLFWWIDKNRD